MSSSDSENSETQHGKNYVHRLEAQLEEATRRINELMSLINDCDISAAKEPSGPNNRQTEQPPSDRDDRQNHGNVVQEAITDGSTEERHRSEPAPWRYIYFSRRIAFPVLHSEVRPALESIFGGSSNIVGRHTQEASMMHYQC